ncbi:hypothetical protein JAO73_02645 [Hymenobacter sp. BT523]|uniref:hypothetical protein n=1 Tax=Hymenobacter sp. BT523 TaxID=2795725 RepID=UPI0018ED138A|nr:hypothetical protein [Hymenobacter sp. BT523]MBJ6107894.1 hypothetical protein [Hymenobacter sp. BT523]
MLGLAGLPRPQKPAAPVSSAEEREAQRLSTVARQAPQHPAFTWVRARTAHFEVYAETACYSAAEVAALGTRAENAVRAHAALLGTPPMRDRVPLFFVLSRARLRQLTGYQWGGFVTPHNDAVFYVATPEAGPALRHELMHRVSRAAWGLEPEPWLREGVATFGAGRCERYTLHEAAASLLREKKAVPLRQLAAHFYDINDVVSYLQSGSVVQFVRDTYGIQAVRTLWRGGLAQSRAATGLSAEALDAAWRAYIQRPGFHPRPVNWEAIRRNGCE